MCVCVCVSGDIHGITHVTNHAVSLTIMHQSRLIRPSATEPTSKSDTSAHVNVDKARCVSETVRHSCRLITSHTDDNVNRAYIKIDTFNNVRYVL